MKSLTQYISEALVRKHTKTSNNNLVLVIAWGTISDNNIWEKYKDEYEFIDSPYVDKHTFRGWFLPINIAKEFNGIDIYEIPYEIDKFKNDIKAGKISLKYLEKYQLK